MDAMGDPEFADVEAAAARIAPHIRATPVVTSEQLSERCGITVEFKCENLQYAGAFKARGASNAVFALPAEVAARGVATHSSGNHAAALARAAQLRGIPAFIVAPWFLHRLWRIASATGQRPQIALVAAFALLLLLIHALLTSNAYWLNVPMLFLWCYAIAYVSGGL